MKQFHRWTLRSHHRKLVRRQSQVASAKISLRAAKFGKRRCPNPDVSKNYLWDVEYRLAGHRFARHRPAEEESSRFSTALTAWPCATKGHWPYGTHKRGGTALSLLALMCGVDANDERVVESFKLLKGTELFTTYDVAVSRSWPTKRASSAKEERKPNFFSCEKANGRPQTQARKTKPKCNA